MTGAHLISAQSHFWLKLTKRPWWATPIHSRGVGSRRHGGKPCAFPRLEVGDGCRGEEDLLLDRFLVLQQNALLNLEVDLLFFDTTWTYFERDEEEEGSLLRYGKSKDKRDDLPQIVIGLAVTKEGIPER